MYRPAAMILLAATVTVGLGACSDVASSGDAEAAVGLYTLKTIDGQPLPAIIDQQGDNSTAIAEGQVALGPDGTFEDATLLRITQSGAVTQQTEDAVGFWDLNGRTVEFNPDDGSGPYAMTWDGANQLTQIFNGFTLVYQR